MFFPQKDYYKIPRNSFLFEGKSSYFTVEIDEANQALQGIKGLANELKQYVALQTTIFFKCFQVDHKHSLIREFLNQISKNNPFTEFSIIIENAEFCDEQALIKLQDAINHISNYNESAERHYRELLDTQRILDKCSICIIQPFPTRNFHRKNKMRKEIPQVSKVKIVEWTPWEESLQKLLKVPDESILIDLGDYAQNLSLAAKVLEYIVKNKAKDKPIFFSDYALQIFYNKVLLEKTPLLGIIQKFGNIVAGIQSKMIYVNKNSSSAYFLRLLSS